MKKIYLLLYVFLSFLPSCKKDWTCECQYAYTSNGRSYSGSGTYPIQNTTYAQALSSCDNTQPNTASGITSAICKLQ